MGSVSSSGVANLLQLLSSTGSPLLSSPGIQSELQNASPQDVVEISMSAIQLQGMDTLLGIPQSNSSDSSALSSIIADVTSAQTTAASASSSQTASSTSGTDSSSQTTTSTSSTDSSNETTAEQVAASEAAVQAAEAQSLFGATSTTYSDPLIDFTA